MTSSFCISRRKLNAFLRIVLSIVTITLLRLTLVGTSRSAYSQTSDDASTSGAAASSPADWTQFHRDNMQRWNPYETILGPSNVGGLKVKWNYRIGASNFDAFQSSPVIVNGVVYLGNQDGNLYAFDAGTGTKLWSSSINEPIDSSPAVANGVVYVGGVASNGNVVALNATTGAKLWSFATRGGIEGSPTVVNGVVYVGSGDGKVYALNAATGVKLWSFNAGSFVDSSPAVANGMVYFGSGV